VIEIFWRRTADGSRYISNIVMPGGTVKYVPLQPPERGATETCSASEWTIDMTQLEKTITPKTKMIVSFYVSIYVNAD